MIVSLLKEPAGLRYNGIALSYAILGYVVGFTMLFQGSLVLNLVGVLLLGHAMIVAAYLIHECGHQLVFKKSQHNARLGRVLSWLCGSAYGTYEDIRYKHFRHHVDNDDVVWFEYEEWFEKHPIILRVTQIFEYVYIPAHDIIMHVIMAFTSFIIPQRRDQRRYNLAVLFVRGGLFIALALTFPKVAVLYLIAYWLMMHVLRFMDALQHDYPYNATLFEYVRPPHKGDREWEQLHTYSVPHSLRFPRLNWLTLNFGYHNAHHFNMHLPWYRLPALHKELTDNDPQRVIPFSSQLKLYHSNRVSRVCSPQLEDYPQGEDYLAVARSGQGPVGGNAASFLVSF